MTSNHAKDEVYTICPLGCGQNIELHEKLYHIDRECSKRIIRCSYEGCDTQIEAGDRKKHESHCQKRLLSCGSPFVPCIQPLHQWTTESHLNGCNTQQVKTCSKHQNHPLIWAAKQNDMQLIELFHKIVGGVDILTFQTKTGDTVLTKASENGNDDIINFLADLAYTDGIYDVFETAVNFETCRGKTALIEAAKRNHKTTVELLCSLHVDLNYRTKMHRKTAWEWAKSHNCSDIVQALNLKLKVRETAEVLFSDILRGDLASINKTLKGDMKHPYRFNQMKILQKDLETAQRQVTCYDRTLQESMAIFVHEELKLKQARDMALEVQTNYDGQTKEMNDIVETIKSIEDDIQINFQLAAVSLKELHNTEAFHTLLNNKTPSKLELNTVKALDIMFNSTTSKDLTSDDDLEEYWPLMKSFLCDSQFYHKVRHFDLSQTLRYTDLEKLIFISDNNMNKFHASLNNWIHTCCKCVRSKVYIQELWTKQNEIQNSIEHDKLNRESRIHAAEYLESSCLSLQKKIQETKQAKETGLTNIKDIQDTLLRIEMMQYISPNGHTLLSWAAATGQSEITTYLIQNGSITFGYGEISLHVYAAIIQQRFRIYQKSLSSSISLNLVDDSEEKMNLTKLLRRISRIRGGYRVPFIEAVYNGFAYIFDVMMDAECAAFQTCRKSYVHPIAIIPYKIRSDDCNIGKNRIMTIETAVRLGSSKFHCKIWKNKWVSLEKSNTYRSCIEKVNEINIQIRTAASISAVKRAHTRLLRERKKALLKWSTRMESCIQLADFKGIVDCVRHGVSFDYETTDGLTPLIRAAMIDSSVVNVRHSSTHKRCVPITFLLDRTDFVPKLNIVSTKGDTALSMAAKLNNVSNMSLLVQRGADVNQRTLNGETSLICAARNGCFDAVQFLLDEGGDMSLKDNSGRDSIEHARANHHNKVVELIMRFARGNFGRARSPTKKNATYQYYCSWGCGLVDSAIILRDHEESCPMRVVQCSYCDIDGLQACDQNEHEANICPARPIPCKLCCTKIPADNISNHMRESCSKRTTQCQMCGKEMRVDHLLRHEERQCKQRPTKCTNEGCKEYVAYQHLSEHIHKECVMRSVLCRRCGSYIIAKDRVAHDEVECAALQLKQREKQTFDSNSTKLTNCKNIKSGCKWTGPEANLDHHLDNLCEYAFLHVCPLRCGRKLQKVHIKRHTKMECHKRLLLCAKCGVYVMAAIKHTHDKYECMSKR